MSANESHARLVAELDRLRRAEGSPSTREIARRTGDRVSYATVADTLSGKRLPSLAKLQLIVKALGGEIEHCDPLWQSAKTAIDAAEQRDPTMPCPVTLVPRGSVGGQAFTQCWVCGEWSPDTTLGNHRRVEVREILRRLHQRDVAMVVADQAQHLLDLQDEGHSINTLLDARDYDGLNNYGMRLRDANERLRAALRDLGPQETR